MQLQTQTADKALILTPSGRLAANTHELLKAAWMNDSDWKYIVVDLSQTQFIDSIGLATLVSGLKTARQREGDLVLVNPTNSIRIILDLTSMIRVFHILSSIDEALAWVATR